MKQIRLFCLLTLGFFGFSGMATVDADLNVTIPCLEVNGGFHSAVLERIQNPLIGGKLEWQLGSYTEGGGLTLGTASGQVRCLTPGGLTCYVSCSNCTGSTSAASPEDCRTWQC